MHDPVHDGNDLPLIVVVIDKFKHRLERRLMAIALDRHGDRLALTGEAGRNPGRSRDIGDLAAEAHIQVGIVKNLELERR